MIGSAGLLCVGAASAIAQNPSAAGGGQPASCLPRGFFAGPFLYNTVAPTRAMLNQCAIPHIYNESGGGHMR